MGRGLIGPKTAWLAPGGVSQASRNISSKYLAVHLGRRLCALFRWQLSRYGTKIYWGIVEGTERTARKGEAKGKGQPEKSKTEYKRPKFLL